MAEKSSRRTSGETTDSGHPAQPTHKTTADVESDAEPKLQRGFHSRHLQFLAIGGTVGTGLFLGTSSALAQAGPVGALLAFAFIGTVVYSIMTSLGEMAAYIPIPGSFTSYASRFLHPSLGFAMGWTYWFSWAMTFALELCAAALILQFWDADLHPAIFISVFWLLFTAINYLPVRWFGEFEMWFSSIKVVTIVGWLIFAICTNAGTGIEGRIGFRYWSDPGPFVDHLVPGPVGRFVGLWSVLVIAGFSFQGSELVGVGAGETRNPGKSVPRAIRVTFWSIFSLFLATVFFIGLLVPSDDPNLLSESKNASASPLVIAARRAGVKVLPDLINAVLLTAVLSAANSNVYSGSRILVALANEGQAPKWLTKTNRFGTPFYAVAATATVGLLAFLNLTTDGGVVFGWLLNVIAIAGFVTWSCISLCHLRFRAALRVQGIDRAVDLPYTAPFQPFLAWYGLFFCLLIILTNGFTVFIEWNTSEFFACYVSLLIFSVLLLGHWLVTRSTVVPLEKVDLVRGRLEF